MTKEYKQAMAAGWVTTIEDDPIVMDAEIDDEPDKIMNVVGDDNDDDKDDDNNNDSMVLESEESSDIVVTDVAKN